MVVASQSWELSLPGCTSLKDKRSVIRSLKDRLRTRYHLSVAETRVARSSHLLARLLLSDRVRGGWSRPGFQDWFPRPGSKPMSKRLARLNEQLKREISGVLRTGVRDPRVGVVTVTGVDTAADLAVAKVYVRTLGSREERDETLAGLEAAAPFVRRELGQFLRVRRVPELRFHEDRSMEHAQRIESILQDVIPDDDGGGAESGVGEPPDGSDPSDADGPSGPGRATEDAG